jgi:ABC-type nitrate/sulfonate/bicarbonate transport system substrate-binding protein
MKPIFSFESSIALCALLLCGGAHAQTTSPQQIHVLTLLGRPIQFVVADKQGLFTKYGLDVVNDNKKNSDELRSDLAAGKGDVAYLAVTPSPWSNSPIRTSPSSWAAKARRTN